MNYTSCKGYCAAFKRTGKIVMYCNGMFFRIQKFKNQGTWCIVCHFNQKGRVLVLEKYVRITVCFLGGELSENRDKREMTFITYNHVIKILKEGSIRIRGRYL